MRSPLSKRSGDTCSKNLSHSDSGKKLPLTVVALLFLYLLYFFAFADIEKVVCRIPDDASYYFVIAENVTSGNGTTFDGIHPTNGFHPLWLAVLLPITAIGENGTAASFRSYLVIQLCLLLAASWVLLSRFERPRSLLTALLSSLLFAYVVFYKSANGMESTLLVVTLVALFLFGWRFQVFSRFHPGATVVFGILLGLVQLTRLDMVFLGVAVSGVCLAQILTTPVERSRAIWRLILVISGAALVIVPYLLYNEIVFGAIVPISGSLKASFPEVSFAVEKFRVFGPIHLPFVLFAALYVPWSAYTLTVSPPSDPWRRYVRWSLLVLGVYVLLHAANVMLFVDWGVFRWQFVPYALFAVLALQERADYILRRWPRMSRIVVSAAIIVVVAVSALKISTQTILVNHRYSWNLQSYKAALWARANTHPTDVFAMKDSGHFAYFSHRKVINLDGVVNNLEYQRVLRSGSLNEYLTNNKVKYIVQHAVQLNDINLLKKITGRSRTVSDGGYETIEMRYRCLKYGGHSEPVLLRRSDEVYKSPGPNGSESRTFVIWKYRRPPVGES